MVSTPARGAVSRVGQPCGAWSSAYRGQREPSTRGRRGGGISPMWRTSVRRAVLVREAPLPVAAHDGLDVVGGIESLIARLPVADLEEQHVVIATVNQVMRHAAGREPGAHARAELRLAGVGHQRGRPFDDVDEFVLSTV